MRARTIAWVVFLFAAPLIASAQDFRGRCMGVPSGDTLEVQKGPRRITVRLAGVAAPEAAQPFGEEARKALVRAAQDREVMVSEKFSDRTGVIHGVVRAGADSTVTLNSAMVAGGLAWSDPATRLVKGLDEDERQAREAGLGLWADPRPIPPWEWKQLAAAGKLPVPDPEAAAKKPAESAFDRMIKVPHYGNGQDGLLKTIIETRQRQNAIEENARQAAVWRRQQAYSSPYYGLDSYFGYDPYFGQGNYGGIGFSRGGSTRSYGTGTIGSGSWSYYPQPSVRTNPYGSIIFPNFNYSIDRRYD